MKQPSLPDDDTKYIVEVTFDGTIGKTYTYYWADTKPPMKNDKVKVISPYVGGTNVTVVKVRKIESLLIRSPKKYACWMAQYGLWMRTAAAETKKCTTDPAMTQDTVAIRIKTTDNIISAGESPLNQTAVKREVMSALYDEMYSRAFGTSNIPRFNFTPNTQQETNAMNSPKIETITFVNGTDVNNMSDDQLIALVKDIDKNIAVLKELGELPKRLAKRMETLEADRKKLFELLDRDAA